MPTSSSPISNAPEAPAFSEPWQAQAFALAVALQDAGVIDRAQWTKAFSEAIAAAEASGGVIDAERYHRLWVETLEALSVAQAGLSPRRIGETQEAWAQAYRRTPHGQPVELAAGSRD